MKHSDGLQAHATVDEGEGDPHIDWTRLGKRSRAEINAEAAKEKARLGIGGRGAQLTAYVDGKEYDCSKYSDVLARFEILSTDRKGLRDHLVPNVAVVTMVGVGLGEQHARLPPEIPRLRILSNDIVEPGGSYVPGAVLFSDRDARRVLRFVLELPPQIGTIVIQCRGGASRSVAVASALRKLRGEQIERRLLANQHIYDTILRVANDPSAVPVR